jgi:trk system potassium uptake protein TrkA
MRIVLVGGGRIGRYIATDLVGRGHSVTIVERDASRVEDLVARTGLLAIEGEATDLRYLEQARVDEADVLVATTHDDEVNLVACQLAKVQFGLPRAISRVNDPRNVEVFSTLGIEAVSSTRLISELIEAEFGVAELISLTSIRGGRVDIVEVRIPDGDDAPAPRAISELDLPTRTIIAVLFRGEETVVPRGSTEVRPGDEIVAITDPADRDALLAALLGTA